MNQNRDGRFDSKVGQIGPKWDKCTEIWSEKAPDLSHLGPIWPTLEPNLAPLGDSIYDIYYLNLVWISCPTRSLLFALTIMPRSHTTAIHLCRENGRRRHGFCFCEYVAFVVVLKLRKNQISRKFVCACFRECLEWTPFSWILAIYGAVMNTYKRAFLRRCKSESKSSGSEYYNFHLDIFRGHN